MREFKLIRNFNPHGSFVSIECHFDSKFSSLDNALHKRITRRFRMRNQKTSRKDQSKGKSHKDKPKITQDN